MVPKHPSPLEDEIAALRAENRCLKEIKRLELELSIVQESNRKRELKRREEELADVQAENLLLKKLGEFEDELDRAQAQIRRFKEERSSRPEQRSTTSADPAHRLLVN